MSKIFATKTVPAHDVVECVSRKCDICGKTAKRPYGGDWDTESTYDVSRSVVECEEGSSFPEGRMTKTVSFDICPECFHEKLVPAMLALGAAPATEKDNG